MRLKGTDKVTFVRVSSDYAESQRRQAQDKQKKNRQEKLAKDKKDAEKGMAEISKKWDLTSAKSQTDELKALLEEQKRACDVLVSGKNDLIAEFRAELKIKDNNFVTDLRSQAQDVQTVLNLMTEQIKSVYEGSRFQMEEIEKAFIAERNELILYCRQQWEALMKTRRDAELSNLEKHQRHIEDSERQLDFLRLQDSEEYNIVKIKLETDIQILQQQLQQMRATYQLNSEKLEYNYQVLKKRDEENTIATAQQKRRINRLQDVLNHTRSRGAKQAKQSKDENAALTEDYKRIVDQFKELQKKVRYFQRLDGTRHDDIWHMMEEECVELAQKVLAADKVIHEQQLGLQWKPPQKSVFQSHVSLIADAATDAVSRKASEILPEIMSGDELPTATSFVASPLPRATLKKVLTLLSNNGDFLVEAKLAKLLSPLSPNEQVLIKLDAILKTMHIHSEDAIHEFARYFIVSSPDDAEVKLCSPDNVVTIVRAYVEERESRGVKTRESEEANSAEESRDPDFWTRLVHVIPDEHEAVWDALSDGLTKYVKVLEERRAAVEASSSLQEQNAELRQLLKQYLSSQVNKDLQIPPSSFLGNN